MILRNADSTEAFALFDISHQADHMISGVSSLHPFRSLLCIQYLPLHPLFSFDDLFSLFALLSSPLLSLNALPSIYPLRLPLHPPPSANMAHQSLSQNLQSAIHASTLRGLTSASLFLQQLLLSLPSPPPSSIDAEEKGEEYIPQPHISWYHTHALTNHTAQNYKEAERILATNRKQKINKISMFLKVYSGYMVMSA